MQGNASKHKAMSWGYANKLEQQLAGEVQTLLKLAQQADQEAEAEQQELDIPEELQRREERLAAIRDAKEKIEERAQERHAVERAEYEEKLKRRQEREAATGKKMGGKPPKEPEAGPKDKDQVNFTDEESRIMPGAKGDFIQGYNAQAVVEQDSHIVVATHVSQAANDKQEMEPALNELKKVEEELGKPEVLVADAGYHSKENVERCVEQDIEPYIAGSREHHNQPLEDRLNAPPECPADADAVTAMQHRMQTAEGKAIYSKRKSTVETVFGVIKEVLGFRRFHLRGLRGAEGEWSLVCTAWNLKRLYAWQEDKWGQCVPVDQLWRRNGRQRHVGGCCWHHDPSRTTSIPPEGPASAPDCALPSQAAASAVPWARSLRNPATRTPTDS